MEYLGRLGLVPRKSKKDRERSPQKRRCGEESRALKTDFTRAIESNLTSKKVPSYPRPASAILGIVKRSLPTPTTTTESSNIPAGPLSASALQDSASLQDDLDYFAYERHVRAQARAREALFGAPGGRHAWKTLIFWKRRRTTPARSVSSGSGVPMVSASSTPYRTGLQTPNRKASLRRHPGCNSSGRLTPLYCCDEFDSTMSIRAWYEPMSRRGKFVSLRDEEFCNRSPYVSLSGRRSSHIPSSPGPLYLV